jgi:hypothetical protein
MGLNRTHHDPLLMRASSRATKVYYDTKLPTGTTSRVEGLPLANGQYRQLYPLLYQL